MTNTQAVDYAIGLIKIDGIEPTDEVDLSEDYFKNPSDEADNQLQKAIELVSK